MEILLGVHYHLARQVMLGAGGGLGILHQPGTPDGRFLLRVSYAPPSRPAHKPLVLEPNALPLPDRDHDGIPDSQDMCPDLGASLHPDPARPGCPLSDQDGDGVADARDACPEVSGPPSSDPKRNGCPALVEVTQGELKIKQAVFFVAFQANILPESIPVLEAVAQTLRENPLINKIEVQGHTDNAGALSSNMDLSQRRASSVVRFLVENGIARRRLVGKGYGPTRPINDNKTLAGREQNRRVQFVILDPPPAGQSKR